MCVLVIGFRLLRFLSLGIELKQPSTLLSGATDLRQSEVFEMMNICRHNYRKCVSGIFRNFFQVSSQISNRKLLLCNQNKLCRFISSNGIQLHEDRSRSDSDTLELPESNKNSYSQERVDWYLNRNVSRYGKHDIVYLLRSSCDKDCRYVLYPHKLKILEYFETANTYFKFKDISNVMYSLGSLKLSVQEIERMAIALSTVPNITDTTDKVTMVDISMALYGLKIFSNETNCTQLLTMLIDKLKQCDDTFNSQAVANSLYGLQNMKVESHPELPVMIKLLTAKMVLSNEKFTNQSVKQSLAGLRSLSSENDAVRQLVLALIPKLKSFSEPLHPSTLSGMINGLQGMSSDSEEVRSLLQVLTTIVVMCKPKLTGQQVAKAFYGLQKMNCKFEEVRIIVKHLTSKLKYCETKGNAPLKAQEISDIIYAMQNMTSDFEVVRHLAFVLVDKVISSTERLKAVQVADVLYSLQNLSGEHSRIRRLVGALTTKMKKCIETMTARDIGRAFYGLQSMSTGTTEVDTLITQLVLKAQLCEEPLNKEVLTEMLYGLRAKSLPLQLINMLESALAESLIEISPSAVNNEHQPLSLPLLRFYQSIILNILPLSPVEDDHTTGKPAIFSQLSDEGILTVNKIVDYLSELMVNAKQVEFQCHGVLVPSARHKRRVNKLEESVRAQHKLVLASGDAVLERNVLLHGFECDLILRHKDLSITNYEVGTSLMEGSQLHQPHIKQQHAKLRDEYLKKKHCIDVCRPIQTET